MCRKRNKFGCLSKAVKGLLLYMSLLWVRSLPIFCGLIKFQNVNKEKLAHQTPHPLRLVLRSKQKVCLLKDGRFLFQQQISMDKVFWFIPDKELWAMPLTYISRFLHCKICEKLSKTRQLLTEFWQIICHEWRLKVGGAKGVAAWQSVCLVGKTWVWFLALEREKEY